LFTFSARISSGNIYIFLGLYAVGFPAFGSGSAHLQFVVTDFVNSKTAFGLDAPDGVDCWL